MHLLFELLLKFLHFIAQLFFQISDLLPYFPLFRSGHLDTFIGKVNSLKRTFPDRMERTDNFQLTLHVGFAVDILAANLMLLESHISILPLFVEIWSAASFGFGEGPFGVHPRFVAFVVGGEEKLSCVVIGGEGGWGWLFGFGVEERTSEVDGELTSHFVGGQVLAVASGLQEQLGQAAHLYYFYWNYS